MLLGGGRAHFERRATHDLFLRGSAGQFAADSSLAHTQNPVGYLQQFRHLGTDHQDRSAAPSQPIHYLEDFDFRPDVDSASGLVEKKNTRAANQPLGDDNFLLIAAAEPSGPLFRGLRADAQPR